MKKYNDSVLNFVQDCYYEDLLKDEPQPMTLEDALYNLTCMVEDEYTDVPEDLTAEDFMLIWNELVANGGRLPACEGSETDVEYNHKTEEENKMTYQINLTDSNGATSAIDTITAPAEYTAEDYIRGCEENADQEWVDMIHAGTVTVERLAADLWNGYNPEGERVQFVMDESGKVYVCTAGGEFNLWNDEYYDEDSLSSLRLAVLNEGYRLD